MQEPRSYGIIGLDMLVAHKLAIFTSSAQLCKMGSGRSAKTFAVAGLTTPIVASVNKLKPTYDENPSLKERCKIMLLNFSEIKKNTIQNLNTTISWKY